MIFLSIINHPFFGEGTGAKQKELEKGLIPPVAFVALQLSLAVQYSKPTLLVNVCVTLSLNLLYNHPPSRLNTCTQVCIILSQKPIGVL